MVEGALFIDNQAIAAKGGTFECRNPFDGAIASLGPAGSIDEARQAADSAQAALAGWAATPPAARRRILLKAADLLEEWMDDLVSIQCAETGALAFLAGGGIHASAEIFREAASMTTQVAGETLVSSRPATRSMTVRRPRGVCLSMAPWNGAIALAVRAIAFPLAFGNTVVLKASEHCPHSHFRLGELMKEAGLPRGCLNIVNNRVEDAPQVVAALIAHPAIRHINFTGSSKVGRIIGEQAARHLKPSLLELGGKSPFIVLGDADLDQAVDAAVFGAYVHQGQVCMSSERILVDVGIADEFARKMAKRVSELKTGAPADPEAKLSCLIDSRSANRVAQMVREAVSEGAVLLAGAPEPAGAVLPAILLDRVTPDMSIFQEETFGPVSVIVRVNGDDEAIAIANQSEYGLSSAVYSRDVARALALAERIDVGMCHINGPTVQDDANAPFGGVKASGWGRFGGKAVIEEFTELRWLTIGSLPRTFPV